MSDNKKTDNSGVTPGENDELLKTFTWQRHDAHIYRQPDGKKYIYAVVPPSRFAEPTLAAITDKTIKQSDIKTASGKPMDIEVPKGLGLDVKTEKIEEGIAVRVDEESFIEPEKGSYADGMSKEDFTADILAQTINNPVPYGAFQSVERARNLSGKFK